VSYAESYLLNEGSVAFADIDNRIALIADDWCPNQRVWP
jgi:hypothetical protein